MLFSRAGTTFRVAGELQQTLESRGVDPLVSRIGYTVLGALLALSAGALVYVGASHLLPRAEEEPKRGSVLGSSGAVTIRARRRIAALARQMLLLPGP